MIFEKNDLFRAAVAVSFVFSSSVYFFALGQLDMPAFALTLLSSALMASLPCLCFAWGMYVANNELYLFSNIKSLVWILSLVLIYLTFGAAVFRSNDVVPLVDTYLAQSLLAITSGIIIWSRLKGCKYNTRIALSLFLLIFGVSLYYIILIFGDSRQGLMVTLFTSFPVLLSFFLFGANFVANSSSVWLDKNKYLTFMFVMAIILSIIEYIALTTYVNNVTYPHSFNRITVILLSVLSIIISFRAKILLYNPVLVTIASQWMAVIALSCACILVLQALRFSQDGGEWNSTALCLVSLFISISVSLLVIHLSGGFFHKSSLQAFEPDSHS